MKKMSFFSIMVMSAFSLTAQVNPAISSWLRNTTGIKGRHYVNGNSTPIQDMDSANIKTVLYSSNWVYVRANGVPAYITGPFLDGNPSITTSQNAIFKLPLNPVQNTGVPANTTPGNIGIFINGAALFDYRDDVSWQNSTNSLKGGPLGGVGDKVWNRDAVVAEKGGFDCAKGHPAQGNYHHHQNPSAFKLDKVVISTICNLYDADGLYVMDSTQHAPLIGYAADGFPIYGAFAYKNVDGTGGITRMKSSYFKRTTMTTRTTYANGTTVTPGPDVNATYPIGYFREDYEYIAPAVGATDYLDEHNGRFCITPEYPNGIYCYFATVDANWNSAYPYAVGPQFYGVKSGTKVTTITEPVTIYTGNPDGVSEHNLDNMQLSVFPNPSQDIVAVQMGSLISTTIDITLSDLNGRVLAKSHILPGSTIAYFDTRTYYSGTYIVTVSDGVNKRSQKLVLVK